jgi:hypothetical protein
VRPDAASRCTDARSTSGRDAATSTRTWPASMRGEMPIPHGDVVATVADRVLGEDAGQAMPGDPPQTLVAVDRPWSRSTDPGRGRQTLVAVDRPWSRSTKTPDAKLAPAPWKIHTSAGAVVSVTRSVCQPRPATQRIIGADPVRRGSPPGSGAGRRLASARHVTGNGAVF